jgi:hypothetical protein
MEDVKENIHREIANILDEQVQNMNQNVFLRCLESMLVEGQHFQHFL